ncbi:TRAP transporter permease [Treponema ruminis]|uniref:TRAP transporter 4TM/12TM fusion protein n=1 Tax=Treponema ruminis TaxID=744515 RepID=A0A7W8G9Q5_9SPIR|nr:TRAP transporter permease [Treponema ruminis]MBB5226319.1 TRAP transporter 4TM/12TM fusion protein [Treponema ruminis]
MSDEIENTKESPLVESLLPTTNEDEMKNLMQNLDREQAYREHKCWRQYITVLVSIAFCIFQLYATLSGRIPAQIVRASHLAFVQFLAFLLFPAAKSMPKDTLPLYDVVLAFIGAGCWSYYIVNFEQIVRRAGAYTPLDIAVGIVGIIILFESCRRIVGLPIMIIAGSFILYAFIGKYLPGFLNHRGYKLTRVVSHLYYTTEGIMGTPIGACSTFIFLFILFGAFLEKTGIGQFFIDSCNAIAGGASGGPAKVAVLSSALLGTVSGSSVSNTVGSGSFTIPMMKRLGYRGEFAGAVEAAASTGGQLMPPIMGAAAFLMAESVGLPYITVVKAAIIPALLYFAGIFITVHLEAHKLGLKGLPKEDIPRFLPLFLSRGYMILPLAVIIFFLCSGKTATYSALMGIISIIVIAIAVSFVDVAKGNKPRFTLHDLVQVLCAAARGIISVAIACGMAGIIIGVVTLTGLGLKLGAGLVVLAHGKLFITLLLTMISSIILGMGAPTTANYLITSTITAGAIVNCVYGQVSPTPEQLLPAHMFAFYFGIIADVTPPVALAAIAGAAIAKARPMRTAVNATKLAIGAFIVPYMFIYNPAMLMIGANALSILGITVTALLGMFGISVGLEGYAFARTGFLNNFNVSEKVKKSMSALERLCFLAAGLCCIDPHPATDIFGVILLGILIAMQIFRRRKN